MSKKQIKSIDKGKRGEREAARYLRQFVGPDGKRVEAIRGQQHRGGPDSPDVRHSIPGVHIECKRREDMTLWSVRLRNAFAKAQRETPLGLKPAVVWRRNREPWLISGEGNANIGPLLGSKGPTMLTTATLDDYLNACGYKKVKHEAGGTAD